MIADPCNASLVPGIYGDSTGFLGRFRSQFTNAGAAASTATCGYLLVVPNYFGKDTIITFSNASPDFNPENTTTNNFGTGSTGGTGIFTQDTATFGTDTAGTFVASPTAADARCISACVRMSYYGSITQSQGEVGMVENLPVNTLLTGAGPTTPLSVNQLFQICGNGRRLGTDTLEVIARPNADTGVFADQNTHWSYYTPSGITALSPEQRVKQATCFGFVWRNCLKEPAQSFQVIRNIEWRPEGTLGIAAPAAKQYSRTTLPTVLTALDRSHPSWTRRILNSVESMAGQIASTAFTGALPVVGRVAEYGAARLASTAVAALPMLM